MSACPTPLRGRLQAGDTAAMHVTVDADTIPFSRGMIRISRAVAQGTVDGLNEVAFNAMRYEKGQLSSRIDRPSAFTLKGVQVDRATLTLQRAVVKVSEQRAKYLAPMEFGETVTYAESGETRGSGKDGIVLPIADEITNALGSAGRAPIARAMRLPGAFRVAAKGNQKGGIFQRMGTGLGSRAILLFAQRATYKPTLHFEEDVSKVVLRDMYSTVVGRIKRSVRKASTAAPSMASS